MKIDLAQKIDMTCPSPGGSSSDAKMSYPSLYFTHDEPVDLPDEGTAVIKFRKVESSENTRDPDDPKYRCEIEVHSIDVAESRKKEDGMVSVSDAFRKAAMKKMKSKMEDDYEEED